ncbi:MAG: hypothetical protein ACRELZ_03055 [Candidatus Rokuibacteriota bacterium]
MLEDRTSVLLILSRRVLDRARVVAAKSTISLKLPVSLQIVLRALIEDGLKRVGDPAFGANVESQARAVRQQRTMARRRGAQEDGRPGTRRGQNDRQPARRRT